MKQNKQLMQILNSIGGISLQFSNKIEVDAIVITERKHITIY